MCFTRLIPLEGEKEGQRPQSSLFHQRMVACVLSLRAKGRFFREVSSTATSFLTQMPNVFSSSLFMSRKYMKYERVFIINLIINRLYFFDFKTCSKRECVWDKISLFHAKKACYMTYIGQVKHDNWMAKAYLLGGNSMLIADLLYVTVVKDDALKVLNSLKVPLFYLFCNFILSNKKKQINKRKVC